MSIRFNNEANARVTGMTIVRLYRTGVIDAGQFERAIDNALSDLDEAHEAPETHKEVKDAFWIGVGEGWEYPDK